MGIIYSLLGWKSVEEEDPVTGLTPRQIRLVKESWAVASKDRGKLGAAIMMGLFEKHPEYKQLFPFRDVPKEELKNDLKFKVHCSTVIYGFDQIIENLTHTDILLAILEKMAMNHIERKAPPEGFINIQGPIEDVLRTVTNDETFAAWSKLLTVAMTYTRDKMIEKKPN
ncbi:globin-1-like [Harmonia axyridis]|uniref:globin-1-like n=1 Tax=Harmonia axyridis TaxID=115357 RepID=UPI001E274F84|nr:globin-1-like [Harmonia axyridis]XP_045476110.1 globin-1-like [Harmonia axyridis]